MNIIISILYVTREVLFDITIIFPIMIRFNINVKYN